MGRFIAVGLRPATYWSPAAFAITIELPNKTTKYPKGHFSFHRWSKPKLLLKIISTTL